MGKDTSGGYGPKAFDSMNMSSMIQLLSAPWSNVQSKMASIMSAGSSISPVMLMEMQFALAIYFQDETLMSSIVSLGNNMSKTTVQNIQR